MKKLINDPSNIVDELIDGFVYMDKGRIKRIGRFTAVARIDAPIKNKVGIVIGGGAGHEPLFIEYVGKGMADAEAHGQIFASPSSSIILEAIKVADSGSGVLLVYCNYAGDVMNFNIAQENARKLGIKVETVLIYDDISSAPNERKEDRRGTTATPIIIKIAGAAAESGMKFNDLKKLLEKVSFNSRSCGVSLSACTLPETGLATFSLEEGKMEFGMGLHGEAGIKTVDIMTADQTTVTILDLLIKDLPFNSGDEVIALVNGYGSTTRMEMFIIMKKIHEYLNDKNIYIYSSELGEFCTSQEMAGISITLIKIDEEIKKYYDMVADSSGYKKLSKNEI
ncbi:MAG: dihydroxyacetone kinase subunit DhaK [Actinobacteria bacterium]|nr:dihydroxyacetone kinase subunit DhaK [Actinomycetota bacterium]